MNEHIDRHEALDPFHWITENQAKVLSFLINQSHKITRLSDISKHTDVAYGSVRGALRTLVKENCITKPVRYRRGKFHGISYQINDAICMQFKKSVHYRQMGRQNKRQTDTKTGPLNSSSSFKETTTNLKNILNSHPELEYWRKKGLTSKQIKQWMKAAECDSDIMIRYLCYCRYEMEITGLETSKPVHNVFNWFFKIIEKTGHYPKPKGYKSFQELKNEQERLILRDQKKEAEMAEKIYRERLEIERRKIFFEMMNDPIRILTSINHV